MNLKSIYPKGYTPGKSEELTKTMVKHQKIRKLLNITKKNGRTAGKHGETPEKPVVSPRNA